MKIYDASKTTELYNPDLKRGELRRDTRFIMHHEAEPEIVLKTVEEVADELKAAGNAVIKIDGQPYLVNHIYKDGKEVPFTPDLDLSNPAYGKSVEEIKAIVEPAKEAWDETEEIYVYKPYTDEEYKDILRSKRVRLLEAFDKWEKAVLRGREADNLAIMDWYEDLLDLVESAFEEDNIPKKIKYFY